MFHRAKCKEINTPPGKNKLAEWRILVSYSAFVLQDTKYINNWHLCFLLIFCSEFSENHVKKGRSVVYIPPNSRFSQIEHSCKKQLPYSDCFFRLIAGAGFEPHDLPVMSPTRYQAALPQSRITSSLHTRSQPLSEL